MMHSKAERSTPVLCCTAGRLAQRADFVGDTVEHDIGRNAQDGDDQRQGAEAKNNPFSDSHSIHNCVGLEVQKLVGKRLGD
jgi:hypothetical protein